ncbi:CLAVATA3/ESR (CLE)-related protein 13 [Gossypium raimondii]|uniref:Uncharacterized protein n=2 Tax=Gossypium TaxID=3633 RepID=A0A0D2VC80_GOSRA|nr:CLAVATA3/ESR (CLE)-related protein 13 [Gossypium raimondii]KJB80059.1 hypothetical protein B456_013G079400 [Gossypium raimondii]MBA0602363.1 hypothetical protein [Gossypium raimondii]
MLPLQALMLPQNSPCMAWKVSHMLIFTILWLSLLLLWLHEFQNILNFNFNTNTSGKQPNPTTFSLLSSHRNPFITRKAVAAAKFDFTPFQKHQDQAPDQAKKQTKPADNEVDPRYGVEKRLVPTGPNPLHH